MAVSLRGYGGARRQYRRENEVDRRGWIRLHCLNPPINAQMRLGPDPPVITGGFGGWETTQRPRGVGMTTWSGVPPFELSLQLLLGLRDLSEESSVERRIQQIINVARGTEDHVPGIVYIDGIPGLPADRWVISNVEFGDVIRDTDMTRIRQLITLQFMEYQPPEYETLRKGSLAAARPRVVKYTVKKGDTPAKIAKGRRGDWKDIREVNRRGVIKKANQLPRKGTPFHIGAKINVTMKDKPKPKKKHHGRRHARD